MKIPLLRKRLAMPGDIFMLVFSFVVLLSSSCRTIDGVPVGLENGYGSIEITSNVDSARIFIDLNQSGRFEFTGKFTSATQSVRLDSVPAGHHTVKLQKDCYQMLSGEISVLVRTGQVSQLYLPMKLLSTVSGLLVSSMPESAQVLVDGVPVGFSPLRVECLEAGPHTVSFHKSNYQPFEIQVNLAGGKTDTIAVVLSLKRTVLFEHFTSSNCANCPEADAIQEDLLKELHPSDVVVIEYHTAIPFPGDPMYIAAKRDNDARVRFYQINSTPVIVVDGILFEEGAAELKSRLLQDLRERKRKAPIVALEIQNFFQNEGSIRGRLKVAAFQDLRQAVLLVAVIEKEIRFANPPGINGQTRFSYVLRKLWPTSQGLSLSVPAGTDCVIPFEIKKEADWNRDQLHVVAFIQDVWTKEILQAAWTLFP